jgi:hypothetical protein
MITIIMVLLIIYPDSVISAANKVSSINSCQITNQIYLIPGPLPSNYTGIVITEIAFTNTQTSSFTVFSTTPFFRLSWFSVGSTSCLGTIDPWSRPIYGICGWQTSDGYQIIWNNQDGMGFVFSLDMFGNLLLSTCNGGCWPSDIAAGFIWNSVNWANGYNGLVISNSPGITRVFIDMDGIIYLDYGNSTQNAVQGIQPLDLYVKVLNQATIGTTNNCGPGQIWVYKHPISPLFGGYTINGFLIPTCTSVISNIISSSIVVLTGDKGNYSYILQTSTTSETSLSIGTSSSQTTSESYSSTQSASVSTTSFGVSVDLSDSQTSTSTTSSTTSLSNTNTQTDSDTTSETLILTGSRTTSNIQLIKKTNTTQCVFSAVGVTQTIIDYRYGITFTTPFSRSITQVQTLIQPIYQVIPT